MVAEVTRDQIRAEALATIAGMQAKPKPKRKRRKPSDPPPEESRLVAHFRMQLRAAGIAGYVTEHRFCPGRKWAFDLAWLPERLAVEVEGGVWTGGRHTRGSGFVKDCEKYNTATMDGWRVLRVHTGTVGDGTGWKMVARALGVDHG